MKIKKCFIIVCSLLFLISIMSVTASDFNDTILTNEEETALLEQTNEEPISTSQETILTSSDDGTFTALQKKINETEKGSTITLENDYKYDAGFKKTGIEINKDLTIDGKGHTIDGAGQARIFLAQVGLIKNHQITLKNIKFTNAYTDLYGGAIFNYANLTVDNCEFSNNHAKYAGGAISSIGYLDCKNSKFTKNIADGDGGAIFTLSLSLHVDYKNLLKNIPQLIGNGDFLNLLTSSASIKFGKEKISNCVFTGNTAKGRGGGAVYAFGNIDIKSSTFNSNNAVEKGGAVFANRDLFISNSKFTGNKASVAGGAVYFKCHANSGHYDSNKKWVSDVEYYSNLIQTSTFTKNSAKKGGAIYAFKSSSTDKHDAKVVKCTFTANKASSGRDVYGGSTSKCVFNYLKLTLKTVKVKKSAKKLVLKAKLTKGKSLIKGKKITFKFNGKTYKAKTNKKGIAKVTIKKSILKKLKVGKKVKYQAKYGKLTVKKSAKVKK